MGFRAMLGLAPALDEGQKLDLEPLVDNAKAAHDKLRAFLRTDRKFASVVCRALGCECGDVTSSPVLSRRAQQIPAIVRKLTPG